MTDPLGGSNLDKYNKKVQDLAEKKEKRDSTKNTATKSYSDLVAKISELESEVSRLEKVKDEINLSETAISYLIDIYTESLTGRRDEVSTRYMEKGIKVESNAINILSELHGIFYIKNEERKYNDFIQGECDIDSEDYDTIIDIKSSWDLYTFSPKRNKKLDKIYEWQLLAYMDLFSKRKSKIVFVLENTPNDIIEDECKRLLYKIGTGMKDSDLYKEACAEIRFNMTYDDIPIEWRVVEKEVPYSEGKIKEGYERVISARKWLNQYSMSCWIEINVESETELGYKLKNGGFVSFEDLGIEKTKSYHENKKCSACGSEDIVFSEDFYSCDNCGDTNKEEEVVTEIESETATEIVLELKQEDVILSPETKFEESQSNELDSLISQIEFLPSESECLNFYKKNSEAIKKYPIARTVLEMKKKSFKKQEPEPVKSGKPEKPKKESEPVFTPAVTEENPQISEIRKIVESINLEFNSTEKFEDKKLIPLKIKEIYNSNKELIDSDKVFFGWMVKQKQTMEIAIKKIEISGINS
jgi:hypothetical protein